MPKISSYTEQTSIGRDDIALLVQDSSGLNRKIKSQNIVRRIDTATRNAIGSPVVGEWIYNTDTNKFNYWNGSAWTVVDAVTGGGDWTEGGDAFGADAILGLTDNFALKIITNNLERVRVLAGGNVGIGTATPSELLTVAGVTAASALKVTGTGGAGFVELIGQGSAPSAPSSGVTIYGDGVSNRFGWTPASGFGITLDQFGLTASRTFTFPDGNVGLAGLAAGLTLGSIPFADASGFLAQDNANYFWDNTAKRIGVGTATPSYIVSLGGNAARTIGMERHTTADTAGNNLTIFAGSATAGATDKNGGDLYLVAGTATGTGSSNVYFQTATPGAAGVADRVATTKMTILGDGKLGIGTASPTAQLSVKGTASVAPFVVDVDAVNVITVGSTEVTEIKRGLQLTGFQRILHGTNPLQPSDSRTFIAFANSVGNDKFQIGVRNDTQFGLFSSVLGDFIWVGDDTGKVGIKNNAPAAQLHVLGAAATDPLRVDTNTQTSAFVVVDGVGATKSYLNINGARVIVSNYNGTTGLYVGANAGALTTANNNVGIGPLSLGSINLGFQNAALGVSSLGVITDSGGCTAIGYRALASTTAGDNTALGSSAGHSNTSGNSNLFVGFKSGFNQTTASNQLFIDNRDRGSAANDLSLSLIYGVFDAALANQRLRLNANVGIAGAPTATSTLNISSLPTSSAGLASGDVWNDSGTLKIV